MSLLCHADCSFLQRQWLACGVLGSHTAHMYIFMQLSREQGCKSLYMRICRVYVHILSLANIYIGYIYIYSMFVYLFACLLKVAYVQIGVNECKCMCCCISMAPPTKRVTLNSLQHG